MWPHAAQRRRWNHQPSVARHSTQPVPDGRTVGSGVASFMRVSQGLGNEIHCDARTEVAPHRRLRWMEGYELTQAAARCGLGAGEPRRLVDIGVIQPSVGDRFRQGDLRRASLVTSLAAAGTSLEGLGVAGGPSSCSATA